MPGEIYDNHGRGAAGWHWPSVHPEGRKFGAIAAGMAALAGIAGLSLLAWPLAPEARASVWSADCPPAGQPLPDLPGDGQASILCRLATSSKERPLFHAVVRIDGALAATWVVWPEAETGETADAKAQREGQAMIALVQLGMGPAEDFARLHQRMCQLRRPAVTDSSDRPDCP